MLAELRDRAWRTRSRVDGLASDKRFFKPATIEEACQFRRDNPDCTIIAGGTDIGVQINKRSRDPKVILSLSGLTELRQIRVQDDAIVAGALASISDLERISRRCPARIFAIALLLRLTTDQERRHDRWKHRQRLAHRRFDAGALRAQRRDRIDRRQRRATGQHQRLLHRLSRQTSRSRMN